MFKKYLLRFESDHFIILVDKITGEYINVYAKDLVDKKTLKKLIPKFEKHKNYK